MGSSDNTIRPFMNSDQCLHKKFSGWNAGPVLVITKCKNADRYRWSYDNSTGLISSFGDGGGKWCLLVKKPEKNGFKRVYLDLCNPDDQCQQWDYVEGRLIPKCRVDLCAGWEDRGDR